MTVGGSQIHAAIIDQRSDFKCTAGDAGLFDPDRTQVGDRVAVDLVVGHIAPGTVVLAVVHPAIAELLGIFQYLGCDILGVDD